MRAVADAPTRVDGWTGILARLDPHVFASRDDVESVAATLVPVLGLRTGAGFNGQRAFLALSPGTVALRVQTVHGLDVAAAPEPDGEQGVLFDDVDEETGRGVIGEWSSGSRRRMARTIAELDYSRWHEDGGILAMVTLTLPGDWLTVAPTGRAFKRMIEVFRRRWTRAVGPWRGLWKLEFQRRGAPHLHALMRVPATVGGRRFEEWLSATWADVVNHPDPVERAKHLAAGTRVDFSGMRFSDPRRTALYFAKHSAKTLDDKEYQHVVPEAWRAEGAGPGRFWGVWGLSRATAEVEVDWQTFVRARRILRHVARARAAETEMSRLRASGRSDAVWTMRRQRPRGGFGAVGGGFVLVNDGLTLAQAVGRALG